MDMIGKPKDIWQKENKMEIKGKLNKPYTEEQRINFVLQYQYGYELKETKKALEAWGKTDAELLEQAKQAKYDEALDKAYEYQENGTVEYKNCVFEMSKANRDNLRDTVEALTLMGETETTWNDKNDELVVINLEDIQYIRLNLILGNIQKLWIQNYPTYKQEIAEAQTIADVNAIVINYGEDNE